MHNNNTPIKSKQKGHTKLHPRQQWWAKGKRNPQKQLVLLIYTRFALTCGRENREFVVCGRPVRRINGGAALAEAIEAP